jgi:hypothetical protein
MEGSELHGIENKEDQVDVIPMQELGVVDVEGGDVSSESLVEKAFQNVAQDFQHPVMEEKGYVVRRGSECVNEYARRDEQGHFTHGADDYPNHLLGAYPYLFPYGEGGFETERPRAVSYVEHARWALQYEDRRFSRHMSFIFQVFGVIQKRQVCRSAELQVKIHMNEKGI